MFDDFIKTKANGHEAPVPPDAWDNIVKKKKNRRLALWWWGSALLLLLLLSTGGYYLFSNKENNAVAKIDEDSHLQTAQKTNEPAAPLIKEQTEAEPALPPADKSTSVITEENSNAANKLTGNHPTITAAGKAKITSTNSVAEENALTLAVRNKKIKKIKGKLQAQQTNAATGELITNSNNEKSSNDKLTVPAEEKDNEAETSSEQTIAVSPVDIKPVSTIEEKKTTASETNKKDDTKTTAATATKKIKKHWFIEAAAIPLVAASQFNENISFNRTLALNNSVSVYRAGLVKASIEPAVAFSFLVQREMSKKVAIGTGLQYMLLKENISVQGKETNTTFTIVDRLENGQLIPDTVTTVAEGTRTINAVNSYQLFSIPLFVQYSIIQKPTWSVGAVGGFYFNISSNYKNEINRHAAAPLLTAPGTQNKSNKGMDIFAGVRIAKKLNKRLDLFAMPSMRWSLAKYNIKNSLLDKNINQAGVGFGLCYKIN